MTDERRADDARIAEILEHLRGQERLLDSKLEPVRLMLEEHHKILRGNGSPGLVIEVDRLKQLRTYVVTVVMGFLAMVGERVYHVLFRGGN